MERNERLERISDAIRRGVPVTFSEAIEAIDYQDALRRHAKYNKWWRRVLRKLRIQPEQST